ncbi:hypothetical protein DYL59_10420 [Pseudomonas kairouanensis]|uniref:Uncharacterized protein n=1 Tax=Pseudomonas kairouanensis TaxID=2293832 RepID=A0A4Z0ASG5_9PSED|nr:hypothetical protein [Pseudomonas kairouanensis]TFY89746.1 hypothetical protein DYL59_10420 [Pseudomonas kairouanensis]
MLSSKEYISLEAVCTSIKADRPALLEGLAHLLLGAVDTGSQFNQATICVIKNGKPNPDIALTYQDIGEYLMAATGKHVPALLHTANGAVESSRVLVERRWISRQLSVVLESVAISSALTEPAANQILSVVQAVNSDRAASWIDQPAPMSADGYKRLRKWLTHQNDQRKANESASKLTIELQVALARAEKAETIALAKNAEVTVLESRDRLSMMELSAKERTIQSQRLEIQKLQERLEVSSEKTEGPRRQPAKERAILAVHEMAAQLWASPDFKDYRIGDMADFIKIHMIANEPEHAGAMPELTSTVVKWLKQMTGIPDGASRPGRPPNSKN